MLPVLSNIDDVSFDFRVEWDLGYRIETSLILNEAEFFESAILEEYSNAKLTFIFCLMSENIYDFFRHVVDHSLPGVHMLESRIFLIFVASKPALALPLYYDTPLGSEG